MTALSAQVAGTHYAQMSYQPIRLIARLSLDFFQGNILKYLCRYRHKNGIEDLEKARHYARLASELIGSEDVPTDWRTRPAEFIEFCRLNDLPTEVAEIILASIYRDYRDTEARIQTLINNYQNEPDNAN